MPPTNRLPTKPKRRLPALQEQVNKAATAYEAARKTADEKRELAEQAKAELYQLIAARKMPSIMEIADAPKPANKIDEIVFAKLKTLGVQPVLCSDAVFVRRAYLDVTGKLPSRRGGEGVYPQLRSEQTRCPD